MAIEACESAGNAIGDNFDSKKIEEARELVTKVHVGGEGAIMRIVGDSLERLSSLG